MCRSSGYGPLVLGLQNRYTLSIKGQRIRAIRFVSTSLLLGQGPSLDLLVSMTIVSANGHAHNVALLDLHFPDISY